MGTFADTAERIVFTDHDVFDINAQEVTMLGTRKYNYSYGRVDGLYKLDLKTGEEISTLRNDSVFCGDNFPVAQKSYLLFPGKNSASVVLPFDGSKPAVIRYSSWLGGDMADENYVYTHTSHYNNELTAYDRRTGEKVAALSFPNTSPRQMMYAFFNNRVYLFDKTGTTVREEEVVGGSFKTIATYNIGGLSLPQSQDWFMLACKGPSLFFFPTNIDSAEAGTEAANTATLITLSSGKQGLRISPFYVRTAEILAKQIADKNASKESYAKLIVELEQKKKEDAIKKASECKKNWGNSDFNKGVTRKWGEFYIILESYDCDKDEYKFWLPKQQAWSLEPEYKKDYGYNIRFGIKPLKQYYKCQECDGDGSYEVTTYTTKVKDLPWGYFSGIETKSIRTTATTRKQVCNVCHGQGIVLK